MKELPSEWKEEMIKAVRVVDLKTIYALIEQVREQDEELANAIHTHIDQFEYKKIPVIFLSALSEPEKINRGFELGVVDYITKPFSQSEVLSRVKTHLELKRYKDHLEKLVQEKTSELQASNEHLQKAKDDLEAVNTGLVKINAAAKHFVPNNGGKGKKW
ncbi:MAG: response regulator [Bacteroidetes bacterium]|nr:response regulator [Bacteroidota bacterium]